MNYHAKIWVPPMAIISSVIGIIFMIIAIFIFPAMENNTRLTPLIVIDNSTVMYVYLDHCTYIGVPNMYTIRRCNTYNHNCGYECDSEYSIKVVYYIGMGLFLLGIGSGIILSIYLIFIKNRSHEDVQDDGLDIVTI